MYILQKWKILICIKNNYFPQIQLSGGIKSKISEKIVDSYLIAKSWDKNNLKMEEKPQLFKLQKKQ